MENNMQIYKSEKFGEIRTLNLNTAQKGGKQ